jgi:hypothetical protein
MSEQKTQANRIAAKKDNDTKTFNIEMLPSACKKHVLQ